MRNVYGMSINLNGAFADSTYRERFLDGITRARLAQAEYDKHVAPIVVWAVAEYGTRRSAYDALNRLKNDDGTSDTAFRLIDRAVTALAP